MPNPEIPSDFYNISAEEVKRGQQSRTDEVERLSTLRLRSSDESKRKPFKYTYIRVRFPNNFVLQVRYKNNFIRISFAKTKIKGVFTAEETLNSVRSYVHKNLQNQSGIFTLSSSAGQLTSDEQSLSNSDLTPSGVLFFSWDNSTLVKILL